MTDASDATFQVFLDGFSEGDDVQLGALTYMIEGEGLLATLATGPSSCSLTRHSGGSPSPATWSRP